MTRLYFVKNHDTGERIAQVANEETARKVMEGYREANRQGHWWAGYETVEAEPVPEVTVFL